MAKRKSKKNKTPCCSVGCNAEAYFRNLTLQAYTQATFNERANQFQHNGSAISTVYEGLDLDNVRIKRRISAVVSVFEEVKDRYSAIAPDSPGKETLTENWVTMNAYPVSAYDYVEKYVFSTLGASIWILDYIRDNGKTDHLKEILRNAPASGDVLIPDVWDPCHSQQLLRQMVSIINNRNSDCPAQEKAVRKNKATVSRIYMDRPTAENKIDHSVPSRRLFDKILALIDPAALSAIEKTYQEKYWDWLHRYFLCRAVFAQEEQGIRAEIEDYQNRIQTMDSQKSALTQNKKQLSILINANSNGILPQFVSDIPADQLNQVKAMAYQQRMLYDKQEAFNNRLNAFNREIGELPLISSESIEKLYGPEIASIWADFEMEDPYSMCMAFLSLLDRGSDLPWCYFPSVSLQSCYVCMLPWTRTKYIPDCDDIWEHFDIESGAVIPGPTKQPLSKRIKLPDMDDWYRMQYRDSAKSNSENTDLFSLSHILYEVTGCLMPRKPERFHAALNTLNRYGINTKKANKDLLYCMALLSEAKHQSHISQISVEQTDDYETLPDTIEGLQEQLRTLKEELTQYKHALQEADYEIRSAQNQVAHLQRKLSDHNLELQDLSDIVFGTDTSSLPLGVCFPYRTASHIVVFAEDESWAANTKAKLPDVLFFHDIGKANSEPLRKADIIWIQPKGLTRLKYQRIINEARKFDTPVRIFPYVEITACAALLAKTDISSCS